MEEIRLLLTGEEEELNRFLERCYGHGRDFFPRHYPQLVPQATECSLILKSQGKIAGHVGTYPLELKVGPSTVVTGAIGGVAADPQVRGRGIMSKLMNRSIEIMEEKQMPLSVLWGDRQRYRNFGYETCGVKYQISFTRRSLERAGIKPIQLQEVDSQDPAVLEKVRQLHSTLPYRVERRYLELTLRRPGVRVFMADAGYLISMNEYRGDLVVQEVVSPSGRELELICGALDWTFGEEASLHLALEPIAFRLYYQAARSWSSAPQGMFKIINWPQLCEALVPYFAQAAKGLPAFELAIGCSWQEKVQVATVRWDGKTFTAAEGREAAEYVEFEAPKIAGMLLGGPFDISSLGLFGKLLPVPIHIPNIDHV